MKYDILVLQALQKTLEDIRKRIPVFQAGICHELSYHAPSNSKWIMRWIRNKYMPHKHLKVHWWPTSLDCSDEELEQSKKDRIAFLERIIEDLMCGE
jgi:hypothetical protein